MASVIRPLLARSVSARRISVSLGRACGAARRRERAIASSEMSGFRKQAAMKAAAGERPRQARQWMRSVSSGVCNAALADGSVRVIRYNIALPVLQAVSHREDGMVVDTSAL